MQFQQTASPSIPYYQFNEFPLEGSTFATHTQYYDLQQFNLTYFTYDHLTAIVRRYLDKRIDDQGIIPESKSRNESHDLMENEITWRRRMDTVIALQAVRQE
ncbi:hypothetical protein Trydic_g3187 [Trypoxylus dichotomus]